jgi:DNA polymerase-3 subunit alpha
MGFEGYFLIVADFIAWARANSIPVGPGRGSGVGSLAAYALGITNLDPLAHDLIFERFLNPSACRCRTSTSTSASRAATA